MQMGIMEISRSKRSFGNIQALKDISMELRSGEICCLMGEIGAGKSTIIEILARYHTPDGGEIRLDGHVIHLNSPSDSQRYGISVIQQELYVSSSLAL